MKGTEAHWYDFPEAFKRLQRMKSLIADQKPWCGLNVQISSLDTSLLSRDQFSSLRRLCQFQISHPPWIKLEAYVSCANRFELQPHSIMQHQNSRRRGDVFQLSARLWSTKKIEGNQKKNIDTASIKSAKLGNAEHLCPKTQRAIHLSQGSRQTNDM